MQQDIRAAVEEVLAIEREADALVDRARDEARALRSDAVQEAARQREQLASDARRKAEAIVAAAREESERERQRRLEDADRVIGDLERSAQDRLDTAVHFAAARLLGKPAEVPVEGSPGPHTPPKTG